MTLHGYFHPKPFGVQRTPTKVAFSCALLASYITFVACNIHICQPSALIKNSLSGVFILGHSCEKTSSIKLSQLSILRGESMARVPH